MKKLFILLAVVVASFTLCAPQASAQDNPFSAGKIMASAYVGMPYTFYSLRVPPVGVTGEYGIVDFGGGDYGTLGAGGAFDMELRHGDGLYMPFEVSGYAAYHYFINPSFEVHAKAGLGFYHWAAGYGGLSYYEFAGISYFLSPSFALTAEAGYSALSYLHLGISIVL
jgi:hypothetical protein